ncbi:hypothetical protein, partial [Candidatus Magnetominusculus dajiuhuensis]|uniref:hypothetical protein n=1 Tax=Candidatus Magnetominusculus dajiuhuensis TaxID=3137712 RepID=UPI003B42F1D3
MVAGSHHAVRAIAFEKKVEDTYAIIHGCFFPSFRLVRNLPFSGSFMMIVHILRHKDNRGRE